MADAVNAYQGAVILISHDFHLLEMVADSLWLVHNHTCTPFDGDLNDYREFLLNPDKEAKPRPVAPKPESKPVQMPKSSRPDRKIRAALREIDRIWPAWNGRKGNPAKICRRFRQRGRRAADKAA